MLPVGAVMCRWLRPPCEQPAIQLESGVTFLNHPSGCDHGYVATGRLLAKQQSPVPFGTGPRALESRHVSTGMGTEALCAPAVFP